MLYYYSVVIDQGKGICRIEKCSVFCLLNNKHDILQNRGNDIYIKIGGFV